MSAPYDLITSDPWRMLRFLARRVINLEHNLPDSLGGEEAFLEELPFGLQIFVCESIFDQYLLCGAKLFSLNLRGECTCWVSLWPGGEYGGSLPLSGGLSGNACLKKVQVSCHERTEKYL